MIAIAYDNHFGNPVVFEYDEASGRRLQEHVKATRDPMLEIELGINDETRCGGGFWIENNWPTTPVPGWDGASARSNFIAQRTAP